MGLTEAELRALANEGALTSLQGEKSKMDMLMKIMMGGWIPDGKRTQWTAFGVALSAIIVSFFQMGAGEMSAQAFFQLVAEKWEVLAGAYIAYFVGEKIDNKKAA